MSILLEDKNLKGERVFQKNQDEDIIKSLIGMDFESADNLTLRVLGGESVREIKVKCIENGMKYIYKLIDLQNKKCKGQKLLKVGTEFDSQDGYNMKVTDTCTLKSGSGRNIFCTVLCLDTGEEIERVRKKDIKEGKFFYELPKRLESIVKEYRSLDEPLTLKNGLKVEVLNQKGGYYGTCDIRVIGASEPVVFKDVSCLQIAQGNFPSKYMEDLVDLVLRGIITGVKVKDFRVHHIDKEYAFSDGTIVIVKRVWKRGNNLFADVEVKETHEILQDVSVYRLTRGVAENPIPKIWEGRRAIASNGQEMCIIESITAQLKRIQFEDGVVVQRKLNRKTFDEGTVANPNFTVWGNKKNFVGHVVIDKLVYSLTDKKDKFYLCKCDKCGMKDILNPKEILLHKCNEGVVKIPKWVFEE